MFHTAKLTFTAKGNKWLYNTELKEHCSQEMPPGNHVTSIRQSRNYDRRSGMRNGLKRPKSNDNPVAMNEPLPSDCVL